MKKSKLFDIKELVCQDVYERDGDVAWRYFRPILIDFLDWFREMINRPVYINNWKWGGDKTQRGLRCNLCSLVASKKKLYVSAHMLGAGIDFNVKGMDPDEVRNWIKENAHRFFSIYPRYTPTIRLESDRLAPTWVHLDFYEHDNPGIVYEF